MILDDITKHVRLRLQEDMKMLPLEEMMKKADGTRRPVDFPFERALRQPGLRISAKSKKRHLQRVSLPNPFHMSPLPGPMKRRERRLFRALRNGISFRAISSI
ncbi:MAG: hypothetical protein U0M19_09610 [Caecibacter sp.]|nr:hypothetical protein [Caecibacter sp.]